MAEYDEPLTPRQWEVTETLCYIALAKATLCFFTAILSGSYSQVDKMWDIIPSVYCWVIALMSGMHTRQVIMSLCVTIWSVRLTFNFARKGGFSGISCGGKNGWKFKPWEGEEDYRWAILRQNPVLANPIMWQIFNFAFICYYQSFLIMGFTVPIILTVVDNPEPINMIDFIAAGLMLFLIGFETVADQQQWDFHQYKKRNPKKTRGFCEKGLWAISRHPNFFAEQSIWVSFYIFSIAQTGRPINWTITGCILLILLF